MKIIAADILNMANEFQLKLAYKVHRGKRNGYISRKSGGWGVRSFRRK